jgi:hypothetical protein
MLFDDLLQALNIKHQLGIGCIDFANPNSISVYLHPTVLVDHRMDIACLFLTVLSIGFQQFPQQILLLVGFSSYLVQQGNLIR